MANRKPDTSDFNTGVAVLLRRATGTKKTKGEDLISDPWLKKAFMEAKKRAAAKGF